MGEVEPGDEVVVIVEIGPVMVRQILPVDAQVDHHAGRAGEQAGGLGDFGGCAVDSGDQFGEG